MLGCSFTFCSVELTVNVATPGEEWQLLFDKRLKEIGIQVGLVPLLPFEKHLYEPGALQDVPQYCKLEAHQLGRYISAREFALEHIDESMDIYQQMKKLKSKEKVLRKVDDSWVIEISLMGQKIEKLFHAVCTQQVLSCFPDATNKISMTQAAYRC